MINQTLFNEYKTLKKSLVQNSEVLSLIAKKQELHDKLYNLEKYSSEELAVREEYTTVSNKLMDFEDFVRFKAIERELNLFVMYCNKEFDKLFDLSKKGKGCKK